ncbi:MAG: hypothetical protein ACON3Z_14600 [Bradymonadia bacterium]
MRNRFALICLFACSLTACDDSSESSTAQNVSPKDAALGDAHTPADDATLAADTAVSDASPIDATPDTSTDINDASPAMPDAGREPADEMTLTNAPTPCDAISLLAPSLPGEAGHYVASVIKPNRYPFAIEEIQYSLVTNDDVSSCNGALAHRVLLFAIENDTALPANPAATGLGYRQYDVPMDDNGVAGRRVAVTVPIPLIITTGQSAVVAIQFATQADEHICVASCEETAGEAGFDWWSNAAMAPFDWRDLVADFGLRGQLMVTLKGQKID